MKPCPLCPAIMRVVHVHDVLVLVCQRCGFTRVDAFDAQRKEIPA